ncbi:YlbE-like family protein [Bacillus sp. Marseille-P3661]|uniref:YlbE-like family protein n=1 Tax=Bacillus sp. Marseille-P3661 TaxID=1936234 RepID=UPI000C837FDC|nr:YlbE-like family protein [Bacillus sp. Marseille-P3661]
MRREIQLYLRSKPELLNFVREKPIWYRLLSRNPEKMYDIEQAAKIFYGRTLPQRLERLQNQIQLARMLMDMMIMSKNNNG